MRGPIEKWTAIGFNEDVQECVVLWTYRPIPSDNKNAKKVTIDFWAETVRYEHRNRTSSGYFVMYHNMEYEYSSPLRAMGDTS